MKIISILVLTTSALILQMMAMTAQAFPGVLQINGDAALQSGTLVRLTPELRQQAGSAFVPVSLGTDGAFHSSFSFSISNGGDCSGEGNALQDGPGADGIVFVVQNVAATALGDIGDGIGFNDIGQKSLGVEFDTWDNGGTHNDPNSNHVGIDTLGNIASDATVEFEPLFNDGDTTYAWIDYDGTTLEVRVSMVNSRPCGPILSQTVDLDSILGGTTAWAGFTSGTGGGCGNHDILSWNYAMPVEIDIEPGKFPNKIKPGSGGAMFLLHSSVPIISTSII